MYAVWWPFKPFGIPDTGVRSHSKMEANKREQTCGCVSQQEKHNKKIAFLETKSHIQHVILPKRQQDIFNMCIIFTSFSQLTLGVLRIMLVAISKQNNYGYLLYVGGCVYVCVCVSDLFSLSGTAWPALLK